jgi:transcriptional regulator with XRE-family HTH domain
MAPTSEGLSNVAKKKVVKFYTSYRFTGQDPIVETVLRLRTKISNRSAYQIAKQANINPATIKNWENKKTRRPQHATLAAYVGALGKKFRLVDK